MFPISIAVGLGWRPCQGKPNFSRPDPAKKNTHSIPFEAGRDHHDGNRLKHLGAPLSLATIGEKLRLIGSSSAVALANKAGAQLPLSTNDVKDKDPLAVVAVKRAARRLDDLAVTRAAEFRRH